MIESPSPSPAMTQVKVEQGSHRDLDSVVEIMETAFDDRFGEAWTRSQCAGILPMPGVRLMIARNADGEAAGFALQRIIAGDGELLLLAVTPKYRRRGIGQSLLREFIDFARNAGSDTVHLEVRDGNPATAMYRSAGFKIVGRRSKYYHGRTGGQYDALTLALKL